MKQRGEPCTTGVWRKPFFSAAVLFLLSLNRARQGNDVNMERPWLNRLFSRCVSRTVRSPQLCHESCSSRKPSSNIPSCYRSSHFACAVSGTIVFFSSKKSKVCFSRVGFHNFFFKNDLSSWSASCWGSKQTIINGCRVFLVHLLSLSNKNTSDCHLNNKRFNWTLFASFPDLRKSSPWDRVDVFKVVVLLSFRLAILRCPRQRAIDPFD